MGSTSMITKIQPLKPFNHKEDHISSTTSIKLEDQQAKASRTLKGRGFKILIKWDLSSVESRSASSGT